MDLSIKRFGPPLREMVGVLQSSQGQGTPRARFLLCRPLGQEAVRTAAIYRVVGERLAREGAESLVRAILWVDHDVTALPAESDA